MKDETQKIIGEFAFDSLDKQAGVTWEAFATFFEKFHTEYSGYYTTYLKNMLLNPLTPEAKKWFCEIFSEEVEDEDEEVDYKKYAFEILDGDYDDRIKFFEQFSEQCISPRYMFRRDIFPYLSDKAKAFYAPDTKAVEEENPEQPKEVFYTIGNRFKSYPGSIYRLNSLGSNRVALVKVDGELGALKIGHIICVSDYSVEDPRHITQEEFSRITGEHEDRFTLIEET